MLEGRGLGVEEGRHALGTVMGAVQVAFSVTASVRKGEQSAESGEIALNPLAEELAQVLVVQPQFLSMIKAGASWARQHAHLAVADLACYTASVPQCLSVIAAYGMGSFFHCLCPISPSSASVVGPASPKLCQATHNWFVFALEMLNAGGLQGNWPTAVAVPLLKYGMGIPLVVMRQRIVQHTDGIQPLLPWAERPRYLECALQAAEWILPDANANSFNAEDLSWVWGNCSHLAASLASGMFLVSCVTPGT